MVLRKVVFTGRNLSDKLEDRYSGPYKIVKVNLNRVTYIIKGLSDGREQKVHHTQLRRYYLAPNYLLNHPSYDRIVLNDTTPRDESPIVTQEPSSDQPLISEDCYPGYHLPNEGRNPSVTVDNSWQSTIDDRQFEGNHTFDVIQSKDDQFNMMFEDYIDTICELSLIHI